MTNGVEIFNKIRASLIKELDEKMIRNTNTTIKIHKIESLCIKYGRSLLTCDAIFSATCSKLGTVTISISYSLREDLEGLCQQWFQLGLT